MLDFVRKFFSKPYVPSVMQIGAAGAKLVRWDRQQPVAADEVPWVRKGPEGNMACPDCGHTNFVHGPSGGMSQNIMCGGCGEWFNMTSFGLIGGGMMIARLFQRGPERVDYKL